MELNRRYGESDTEMETYTEIASGDNRTEQNRIYETLQHGTGELADKTTPSTKKCTRCTLVHSILLGLLIIVVSVSLYMSINVSKASNSKGAMVTGIWTNWSDWSPCNAKCGQGFKWRIRTCTSVSPKDIGFDCNGNGTETVQCQNSECSVDGGWTEWNPWRQCPVLCGVGLQSRSRSCTNPSPANAGNQCVGQNFDVKLCYRRFCGDFYDEDCYAIKKRRGEPPSGIYNVRLWNTSRVIPVYCDFDTDTGGWTVFQYRFNGSVDFYRNFSDYERGFGSLEGEFWLGLENMYEMVFRGKTELRLDLTAADGTSVYETFQNFSIGENPYYTLHIDEGVGTTGDYQGLSYNNGRHFTTFDMDRDLWRENCAIEAHGGWWYYNCAYANLNGEYVTPGTERPVSSWGGMVYYSFKETESLKVSKMMFRRV